MVLISIVQQNYSTARSIFFLKAFFWTVQFNDNRKDNSGTTAALAVQQHLNGTYIFHKWKMKFVFVPQPPDIMDVNILGWDPELIEFSV